MLDPQQEIFNTLRKTIADLGYSVYDTVLPPEGTEYPFVYLGYTQQVDERTKSQINGTVYQSVDVWHSSPKRRGDISGMMLNIKTACRAIAHTTNFSVDVLLNDQSINADDSTGITLVRGMMDFKIKFS